MASGEAVAVAAPTLGDDGTTAAVFSYQDAVRQRVFIPQPGIDQDLDGVDDRIAIEIMRPNGSGPGLKVPAIVEPSPYFSTVCRGNEPQCIGDVNADGVNDRWPMYYDNYFVPRGYAYVLAEMNGTANSSGCPMHGGAGDIAGEKSVIDWLNGRVPGYDKDGNAVVAGWHNGSSAMIGKSYDGTLANGVAATGVEGLETIVPISAISDWYGYSRMGGIRMNTHYPATLSNTVTDAGRRALCAPTRTAMSGADGDETGDMNAFWDERNHAAHVGDVKAAVFATHGLQDDNVKLGQLDTWWAGLEANDVPRKLWLLRAGHTDPFDSRRATWVATLHRWFDHWLYGVQNGIMDEPRVDIEDAANTWNTYADWPVPGSEATDVYLRGLTVAGAGDLGLSPGGSADTLTWTNATQNETALMSTPTGAQTSRRVFLSPPLEHDLRISGTPVVDIQASLDKPQSNLGALIVDYGAGSQVTRSGEGIKDTTNRTCWGGSSTGLGDYSACYLEVSKPLTNVTQWRVTRGVMDSSNRTSLTTAEPITVGQKTRFTWPLQPQDHLFPAGHMIGVILVGNYPALGVAGTAGVSIALDAKLSKVALPIVGGYDAAVASRAFAPDTVAPVLDGVPGPVAVEVGDGNGAAVSYAAPTATDNEDPSPAVACDPASGSVFPIGTTSVTCTAEDAYGNTATATFPVTVRSKAPEPVPTATPQPTPEAEPDIVAPALTRLRLDALRRALRLRFTLSESATVTVTIRRRGAKRPLKTFTVRAAAGKRSMKLASKRLRKGRYVIEIRARDPAGNRSKPLRSSLRFKR